MCISGVGLGGGGGVGGGGGGGGGGANAQTNSHIAFIWLFVVHLLSFIVHYLVVTNLFMQLLRIELFKAMFYGFGNCKVVCCVII